MSCVILRIKVRIVPWECSQGCQWEEQLRLSRSRIPPAFNLLLKQQSLFMKDLLPHSYLADTHVVYALHFIE
jgi:hypothetical protein